MEYLAVPPTMLLAAKILFETYHNLKPRPLSQSNNPPQDLYYSAESIIALMYKYWRWRIDHSSTADEGGNCFLYASESVGHFRKAVAESQKVEQAGSGLCEQTIVDDSDNVIPFRPE